MIQRFHILVAFEGILQCRLQGSGALSLVLCSVEVEGVSQPSAGSQTGREVSGSVLQGSTGVSWSMGVDLRELIVLVHSVVA